MKREKIDPPFLIPCEYCIKPLSQGRVFITYYEINGSEVEVYLHSEGHDPNQPTPQGAVFTDCARNFRLRMNKDLTGRVVGLEEFKRIAEEKGLYRGEILFENPKPKKSETSA